MPFKSPEHLRIYRADYSKRRRLFIIEHPETILLEIQNKKDEFYSHIEVSIDTDCQEWTGKLNKKGYGIFIVHGYGFPAHQIAWTLAKGELVPRGLSIDHIVCNNKKCQNVNHMRLSTLSDNTRRQRLEIEGKIGWTINIDNKVLCRGCGMMGQKKPSDNCLFFQIHLQFYLNKLHQPCYSCGRVLQSSKPLSCCVNHIHIRRYEKTLQRLRDRYAKRKPEILQNRRDKYVKRSDDSMIWSHDAICLSCGKHAGSKPDIDCIEARHYRIYWLKLTSER